jgi:hypothetical protein
MDDQTPHEPSAPFRLEVTLQGRGSFSASGNGELVLRAFDQFREEVKASATSSSDVSADTTAAPDDTVADTVSNGATTTPAGASRTAPGVPLPVYVREKAPKNNAEAVAVIAVHSKQYRGTEEFTNKSMGDLWRGSGRKAAGNLARDIDTAVKSGWLHRQGRGAFVTTEYGEQFVAGLPAKKSE